MTTPRIWPRPVPVATGEGLKNSTSAEGLRRRLQGAMPHGGWKRIAGRLGRADRWVNDQVEGYLPLTVTVALEGLLEIGREVPDTARDAADEILAPCDLAVIRRPEAGGATDVLSSHAAVLAALSHLESDFASAIADGSLDAQGRSEIVGALREVASRCAELETRLGGRSR